jgi:hypothetical protein
VTVCGLAPRSSCSIARTAVLVIDSCRRRGGERAAGAERRQVRSAACPPFLRPSVRIESPGPLLRIRDQ